MLSEPLLLVLAFRTAQLSYFTYGRRTLYIREEGYTLYLFY
jgi:hypothetical protein